MNRDYIETQSGRKVWLPDCDPDCIDIHDIAHALSIVPRFSGHLREHYSVAEHSIHVASLVSIHHKFQALMHDATEAYLCDMPTPFKALMPEYQALEEDIWKAVCNKFGIDKELHHEVKLADKVMLMTERDCLKDNFEKWHEKYELVERVPDWKPIRMWFGLKRASPSYIKGLFLEKAEQYASLNVTL